MKPVPRPFRRHRSRATCCAQPKRPRSSRRGLTPSRSHPQPNSTQSAGKGCSHDGAELLGSQFSLVKETARRVTHRFRLPGRTHSADDVVQEMAVNVLSGNRPARRSGSTDLQYLYAVAMPAAKRVSRASQRRHLSLDERSDQTPESAGPLDAVLKQELREVVREAIKSLPPRLRIPLEMQLFGFMSLASIAAELGRTRDVVNNQLHKAREHLERELRAYYTT
jgi:RNA polymerase sigma factor (sigma-70 family)